MTKWVLAAVAVLVLASPAVARSPHHRAHRRGASGGGMPITKGPSDVRINAVGEVIAPKIGKITVDGK